MHHAQARVAELNKDREAKGLPKIGYGIRPALGNVMFGNVGLKDLRYLLRLRLCKERSAAPASADEELQPLEVVASQAFAGYCGGEWITLGEEKLRGIRQKVTVPQQRAPANQTPILDKSFPQDPFRAAFRKPN